MTERYDLHIHSNISDGTQPLTELVPLVRDAGLAGFALTDHDTARGWPQAAELAGEYGVSVALPESLRPALKGTTLLAKNLRALSALDTHPSGLAEQANQQALALMTKGGA